MAVGGVFQLDEVGDAVEGGGVGGVVGLPEGRIAVVDVGRVGGEVVRAVGDGEAVGGVADLGEDVGGDAVRAAGGDEAEGVLIGGVDGEERAVAGVFEGLEGVEYIRRKKEGR